MNCEANLKVRPNLTDYVHTAGVVEGLLAAERLFGEALERFATEEEVE